MRVGPSVIERPRSGVDEIDLVALKRIVVARKRWIIIPTLLAFVVSAVVVNLIRPRYTAEARIVLENQQNFLPGPERSETGVTQQLDAEAVGSQVQILTSRDLARKVIKTVGLQGNPEFDPLADGLGAVERLMILVGLKRDPTRLSPEDRILESYFDRLTVLSPMKTRVLTIEFSSRDPDLSARVANAIADAYLEFQSDAKRDGARAAAESLGQSIAELKTRFGVADAKVEAFRAQTGLLIGTNSTSINAQQLSDVNTEVAKARTAQADALAKAGLLRDLLRQGRISDIPEVANNELVRRISEQRVTAKAQLALESRTLLSGHPRIKELTAQVADLEGEIRAAADKTARSLDGEAKIASARVDNLTKALDAQKKLIGASGSDEVQLRELDRTARSLKDELDTTTTKYQEALARQGSRATPSDARIFSRALAPQTPSFPKKLPIILISTLGTLLLSLGVVAAREFLLVVPVAAGKSPDIFEPTVPVRGLKEMPAAASVTARPSIVRAIETAESIDAEALDDVVADIETLGIAIEGLFLSVPAVPGYDDGLALALARRLVEHGRVVLVAGDAGTVTPLAGAAGLADLMNGDASFADVIHRDHNSRLHIIPAGRRSRAETDDLASVLDALKGTYDIVVLGVPHAMHTAEAHAVTARANLAVVGPGGTAEAADLEQSLIDAGVAHVLRVQTDEIEMPERSRAA